MASLKNWEAQARTNSILAGSIQALEARVDDCYVLLDWREDVDSRLEEIDGEIIIMKDKQERTEKRAKQEEAAAANQLARRPSILGRLRAGSVTASVSGEDAAAAALRAVTEQLTIVKTKKNPLVRIKKLLSYCIAVAGPTEVRTFSAQLSNLMLTVVSVSEFNSILVSNHLTSS